MSLEEVRELLLWCTIVNSGCCWCGLRCSRWDVGG